MAGIDEASARNDLSVMQDRLARDPAAALGLAANATAEDIRSAFLELTKHYHPVRFGRMPVDIQKLSNEVFLALRAAHDALAKARRRQTGPITAVPAAPPARGSSPGPGPAQSPALPPVPQSGRPAVAPATPTVAPRVVRAGGASDSGERAPIPGPVGTPAIGARTVPRPAAPAAVAKPVAPVSPAPGPSRGPASPVAGPSSRAPLSPVAGSPRPASNAQTAAPRDESAVLDLLTRQQWDQARTALHQLSARDPGSKRLRALACYARGREAQLDGRVDDARVELHDALDLDPDLQLAKTALTELFTRRK